MHTKQPLSSDATRATAHDQVIQALEDSSLVWAWQGMPQVHEKWCHATGPADLDVWCGADPRDARAMVDQLSRELAAAIVVDSSDPRRLRHAGLALETPAGLAIIDLTFGDLAVGPITILPSDQVRTEASSTGPQLTGAAGAADLLIRPLLRGKIPPPERLAAAQSCWLAATPGEQLRAAQWWRSSLGPLTAPVLTVLSGSSPPAGLARQARRWLLRRTLTPRNLPLAARQWRSVLPAGRAAGPLGLRTRAVVVALVGTDGSGKSTVASELEQRLTVAGYRTRQAYFGMAHGNLPGVGIARKFLGVAQAGDAAGPVTAQPRPTEPKHSEVDSPATPREWTGLRRIAAYYYATEYAWRYLSTVLPGRLAHDIVICDRYIYDLRESPRPGSMAARLIEAVLPAPDILALPDAPAAMIHARKPERTLPEQREQQQRLRDLLAEHPSRWGEVIVDTSGASPDAVAPLVLAVVSASHLA